jgi:alpha-galactosidase
MAGASMTRATRIEAYRRGMEAVRRGARDAFLLGCNHA